MAQSKPKRPDKSITLPESKTEITMTYVIFNDVLRFVGSVDEAMTSLLTNQETRDLVIRRLLTDNKKPVDKIEELIPVEEVEIDVFEINDLLGWVMEHVAYFFMKTASSMQDRLGAYPQLSPKTTSSNLSESGSEA